MGFALHPFSIEIPRAGEFQVEQAKNLGIPMKFWSRLQKGETIQQEGKVYTPELVLGPPRKGIKLTYCTDTRPVAAITENARNADLLIIEGMYPELHWNAQILGLLHLKFAGSGDFYGISIAGNIMVDTECGDMISLLF